MWITYIYVRNLTAFFIFYIWNYIQAGISKGYQKSKNSCVDRNRCDIKKDFDLNIWNILKSERHKTSE